MNPSIKISEWDKMQTLQLKQNMNILETIMFNYQKQTDYINAQIYRQLHQNCTKYLQQRTHEQLEQKHDNQINQNNTSRRNKLNQFIKQFEHTLHSFMQQKRTMIHQLQQKNGNDIDNLRIQMQDSLSSKVKQSNQLLNLRRMQNHAANQKNYVQAQSIKVKADNLYNQQHKQWCESKQNRIQQATKILIKKQQAQLQGINRKIKLKLEDLEHSRIMGELKINQNYDVKLKELKALHQRQILSLFKQLRNTGGLSPKIRSKKQSEEDNSNQSINNKVK